MKSLILMLLALMLSGCETMSIDPGNRPLGQALKVNAYTAAEWKGSGAFSIQWVLQKGTDDYPGMKNGWSAKVAAELVKRGMRPAQHASEVDWIIAGFVEYSEKKVLRVGSTTANLQKVFVTLMAGTPAQPKRETWVVEAEVNGGYEELRESVGRALDAAVPQMGKNFTYRR